METSVALKLKHWNQYWFHNKFGHIIWHQALLMKDSVEITKVSNYGKVREKVRSLNFPVKSFSIFYIMKENSENTAENMSTNKNE